MAVSEPNALDLAVMAALGKTIEQDRLERHAAEQTPRVKKRNFFPLYF